MRDNSRKNQSSDKLEHRFSAVKIGRIFGWVFKRTLIKRLSSTTRGFLRRRRFSLRLSSTATIGSDLFCLILKLLLTFKLN